MRLASEPRNLRLLKLAARSKKCETRLMFQKSNMATQKIKHYCRHCRPKTSKCFCRIFRFTV